MHAFSVACNTATHCGVVARHFHDADDCLSYSLAVLLHTGAVPQLGHSAPCSFADGSSLGIELMQPQPSYRDRGVGSILAVGVGGLVYHCTVYQLYQLSKETTTDAALLARK
jgi:hypothetical protein